MYVSQLSFSTLSTRQGIALKQRVRRSRALVLAPNLLDSTDLFLTHGRHHGQEDVLSFIISTLDLQMSSKVSKRFGTEAKEAIGLFG